MTDTNYYTPEQTNPGYYKKISTNSVLPTKCPIKSKLPIEVIILNGAHLQDVTSFQNPFESQCYQIIYLTKGICNQTVDFDQYEINTQNVGFVLPGQISQLIPDQEAQGFIFNFTAGFLISSVDKSVLINPSSLLRFSCLPKLSVTEPDKSDMNLLAFNMAKEYQSITQNPAHSFRLEILGSLLKVFLIYLSRIISKQTELTGIDRTEMTEKFFQLLEEKYKIYKTPADFASELKVSPGYLNEVLKKKTGFTTTYYISQRVMMQAKRLMLYSDISMKKIAYDLGFEDLSHFSKFFKRVCGECFTDYKKSLKNEIQTFQIKTYNQAL